MTTPASPDTFWGNALDIFRRAVAPRLATAVVALSLRRCHRGDPGLRNYRRLLDTATSARTPWVAIVVIGVGSLLFTANATSLHTYYRDRLAHAYLDYGAHAGQTAWTLDFEHLHPEQQPAGEAAGPTLVLCATANLQDNELLPAGRATEHRRKFDTSG